MTDRPIRVFLDANVLARPVTRTLLIVGGPPSGFRAIWSAAAEQEAPRHMSTRAISPSIVSAPFGGILGSTGQVAGRFHASEPADRQILADAEASGARFLSTVNRGGMRVARQWIVGGLVRHDVTRRRAMRVTDFHRDLLTHAQMPSINHLLQFPSTKRSLHMETEPVGHSRIPSRRQFLQAAGVTGLAAFLAACGDTSTTSPSAAGPASSGSGGSVAPGSGTKASSSGGSSSAGAFTGTLSFVGWDFQPDKIKELIADWSKTSGTKVDVQIIPNVGYPAALQTRLGGGDKFDAFYNFAYSSQKFVESGWAAKLDGLPGQQDMLNDMFPSARGRYLDANGSMVSTPYFSAVHMLNYNKNFVKSAGFDGPPMSLSDTYDQCEAMKKNGVCDTPYVAYWIKDFCEEYFNLYLLAGGVSPFSDDGEPAFADDSKAADVFEWWQSMYQDGLTPKSILTDDTSTVSQYIADGTGAFLVLHHYFLTSIRQAKGPQAENTAQVSAGGSNGKTLQIGEVVQMGKIADEAEKAATWELMKYYGWKDSAGKFSVFAAWAKAAGLAAPYAGFFTDPEVVAAFPSYYDLPELADVFEKKSDVVPARTLPWYPNFQSKVGDLVQTMLLGQATPKATIDGLAKAAQTAKSGGGL